MSADNFDTIPNQRTGWYKNAWDDNNENERLKMVSLLLNEFSELHWKTFRLLKIQCYGPGEWWHHLSYCTKSHGNSWQNPQLRWDHHQSQPKWMQQLTWVGLMRLSLCACPCFIFMPTSCSNLFIVYNCSLAHSIIGKGM